MIKKALNLDIKVGDVLLGGRYKNKYIKVKSIGTDELGQPIVNKGRKLLSVRIEKKLPEKMWSSKSLAAKYKDKDMDKKAFLQETYNSAFEDELKKIAGVVTETLGGIVPTSLPFNTAGLVLSTITPKKKEIDMLRQDKKTITNFIPGVAGYRIGKRMGYNRRIRNQKIKELKAKK